MGYHSFAKRVETPVERGEAMTKCQWLPGMRTSNRIRIVSVHSDGYVEGYSEDEGYIIQVGADAEPDENDPVTKLVLDSYRLTSDKE